MYGVITLSAAVAQALPACFGEIDLKPHTVRFVQKNRTIFVDLGSWPDEVLENAFAWLHKN